MVTPTAVCLPFLRPGPTSSNQATDDYSTFIDFLNFMLTASKLPSAIF